MTLLPDGYLDLAAGKIANVVTHLEMRARPPVRSGQPNDAVLRRVVDPDLDWYRALYHRVGDEYLWSSRLAMSDEALCAIIHDPLVEVYALEYSADDEGFLELDFRTPHEAEIVFFGVTDALVGGGYGRWLMNRTLEIAWSHPIERLTVHTCTLDHPRALEFYVRSGFVPYKRQVEVLDDPRVLGLVPRSAAANVPIL